MKDGESVSEHLSASRDGELLVVLVTLSEPVAASFAQLIAGELATDERFDIIGVAARRGWHGGAADIVVRVAGSDADSTAALDAAMDRAVEGAWPQSALTGDAVVLMEVVPAGDVPAALGRAHVTVREALQGMGLY